MVGDCLEGEEEGLVEGHGGGVDNGTRHVGRQCGQAPLEALLEDEEAIVHQRVGRAMNIALLGAAWSLCGSSLSSRLVGISHCISLGIIVVVVIIIVV